MEGRWVVQYATRDGVVERPVDLSQTRIAVLAPAGDGYEEILGEGFEDGGFAVHGVPAGPYFLIHGEEDQKAVTGFQDDRDFLQVSRTELGRPDRVLSERPPEVALDLDGLSPWQKLDTLFVLSPEVSALELVPVGTSESSDVRVEAGATEIRGQTFEWTDALIDPAHGDRSYIFQRSYRDFPVPHTAVSRAVELPELEVAIGDQNVIAGTLEEVPEDRTFRLSISPGDVVGAIRMSHPSVRSAWTFVYLEAQPRWGIAGKVCATPFVTYDGIFGPDGTVEAVDADLPYGDPFPPDWDRFLVVETHAFDFDIEENYEPGRYWGHIRRTTALDRVGDEPLAPLVTAPQAPAIDGVDGFAGPRGVGETPELTWSPPIVGEPTQYLVGVYRSFRWVDENGVRWHDFETLVELYTTETRLVVPGGLLEPGNLYFATITAWAGGDLDQGSASVVTSLFEP